MPVPAATEHDEEILDLWDNIWFGVSDSPPQLRLNSSRQAKATADPLDSVPLLNGLATGIQTASALGSYQRHAVAAAMAQQQQQQQQLLLIRSQQQAGQQQRHLLPTVDDGSILVVPQQNSNTLTNSSNTGSKAVPMPQEDQQTPFAEQLDSSMQQQQQQQGPAPYVLGTWAQRQFIMPLNKALQKADDAAAAAQQAAAMPGTSVAQPIPANGRWPSNGSSGHSSRGSNGSKASKGSGGAAAAAAASGDADGVDAATTAAPAAEVGQLAQVHGGNAAALAAAAAAAAAAVEDAVVAQRGSRCSFGTDEEEEAVQQAAWRWRFAKRWQAEQTRPPAEHAEHASVGDGGMEEALQYLAACGENWHLARAASIDPASDSRLLGTLGTPSLLSAELLVDESFSAHGSRGGLLQSTGSDMLGSGCLSREASSAGVPGQQHAGHHQHGRHGAGRGGGEATQQVTGITKRAAQLLAAQSDINKAVTQRWREVQSVQAGELWVGALLESAEVDDWGSYKFLLLRLRDRAGRQKLLVRGANYASDAKIVEGLHRQMMAACAAHDVCAEAIEVVGGGIMEWRRHRDRHLHISGGYVGPASGPGGPSTGSEVMNLAAVLTKQHLPMHYKVTSEGGKVL